MSYHINIGKLIRKQGKSYYQTGLTRLLPALKPNYFKKQCFLSSFFLPKLNNRGPKWHWSTQQANSMHLALSTVEV